MTDAYTRAVLTVIAAALVVIALRGLGSPIATAHAGETLDCRVSGQVEIRGPVRIESIGGSSKVQIEQAYGEAGSSSGNPLYVKNLD